MSVKINSKQQELLQIAQTYLQKTVSLQANQIDSNPKALTQALQGLGDRNLLGLRIPEHFGGGGFNELEYRQFQIAIARYSGALAFLQTQHQSAGSFLAASHNQSLQQRYLPQLSRGKTLIGVGFSQLRCRGKPIMQAREIDTGYVLNGQVPWITGWGFFNYFIIGANLPDEREIYGILPLENQTQTSGGSITLSSPMELIAMNATNTVTAKIKQWFLSPQEVVAIKPIGSIHENSKKNILHHGFFALGCGYAGLDILQQTYERKQLSFIAETWKNLKQELDHCQQTTLATINNPNFSYQEKLRLRTWAINLAGRCSQAAVIASSGAANFVDHAAGRVYREALLFSVSGQTTDVMEESLKRLLIPSQKVYN